MGAEEVRATKRAFAAMELRRIEIGGGVLPAQVRDWLLEATDEFPGLKNMAIDDGFRDPWVRPDLRPRTSFKSQFDGLEGKARLQALEDALSGEPSAGQATDWLRRPGHAVLVLCDFEAAAGLVNRFPRVWDHFGYFHSRPAPQSESEQPRDAQSEANRVLGPDEPAFRCNRRAGKSRAFATGSTCGPSMLSGASWDSRYGCAHGRPLSRSRMRPRWARIKSSLALVFDQPGKSGCRTRSIRFICPQGSLSEYF